MSEDTYKTIAVPSEGIYTEKRSKFIAIALPVRTVEEVKAHLETYQKKYYDARHVCYAYMLGHERKDFRANDNGEPSGTAGKPILGQINSNGLTDILIVVVRYFGGIKLGTSGLIVAYKAAAAEAIAAATVIEKTVDETGDRPFRVSFHERCDAHCQGRGAGDAGAVVRHGLPHDAPHPQVGNAQVEGASGEGGDFTF